MPTPNDDFDNSDPFTDDLSPEQTREIERRMNIHRLQNEADAITGGHMKSSQESDTPSEVLQQFWEYIVDYEKAPLVTIHQKLLRANLTMPADGELNEAQLYTKLWQIIDWMAEENIVLAETDHLSDRELYVWLRDDCFHEPDADMPDSTCHLSPIGACSEADITIRLRYYADEAERAHWLHDFPADEMPPHETPLYDRDRRLPDSRLHREYFEERQQDWDKEG